MKKTLYLYMWLLFLSHFAVAQQAVDFIKPVQVTPPSPISYQMSKYGGINTSLISGAPNVDLPLLNFQAKSLSVPIGIRYTSAGIKVDQIASRVGMGWDFEGGGVISRIVYDVPDELGIPIGPVPSNLADPSDDAFNFYNSASGSGSVDTQPDQYNFSFGGYSGKFIVVAGVIKQIIKSELKIEQAQEGFDFKITTPDGNKYYFGGAGAIETSNSESTCDVHQPSFPATAWHLKKIVAYTGETINFTYGQYNCFYFLGVNETMTRLRILESEPCATNPTPYPAQLDDQFCASKLKTFYCLLSEISSSTSGLIKFSYINRADVPGEYLISKIRYFSSQDSSKLNSLFVFNYAFANSSTALGAYSTISEVAFQYRAFLSAVQEYSGAEALIKTHSFDYNDMNSLPPRLSFCQDFLGYYNGKPNLSHIIPRQPTNITNFPPDLADRSVDFELAKKGLLTKIHYPTGGTDSLVYEANTIYESVLIPATPVNTSVYGTGTGSRTAQVHTSATFTPLVSQVAVLSGYCSFTGDESAYLPDYHLAKIEVVDQTVNQVVFLKGRLDVGEDLNENISLTANHTYFLRLTPYGADVLSSINIQYRNAENTSEMQNVNVAGIRIQKAITKSAVSDIPTIKRYYYASPQSGFLNSSGLVNYNPEFNTTIDIGAQCFSGLGPNPVFGIYDGLYSYATNTQYLAQTPVQYQWVAESFGDNFENGGIAHQFLINSDAPGEVIHGKRVAGAALSNYGVMNGMELKNITYAKKSNQLVTTKLVETHYAEDPCSDFALNCVPQPVYAYVVRRNYGDIRVFSPHNVEDMRPFDAVRYKIMGYWFYADTIKTTTYDENGNHPMVDLTINKYENVQHSQLTSSTSTNSDQKISSVNYLYPYDSNTLVSDLSSPQITALVLLTAGNKISVPVQSVRKVDNIEVERTRIDFADWGSGMVLPEFYKIGNSPATLENRVSFYGYDTANGNLKSQSVTGGAKSCYLWSYNGQYPVAEIKNAEYASVEALLGGAATVAGFTNSFPSDAQVAAFLAPLYSAFPDAQITTYTYNPLVGMTSSTDAKGMTTYYEYDASQRLKAVKDQHQQILKTNTYHYKN